MSPCICSVSNRSQMSSKCGKNKNAAHKPHASVSLIFWPLFCCPLWSSPIAEQTHVSNMESINLFYKNIHSKEKKNKTDRQPCCVLFGCSRICASLGISKPQNNNIFFHLYFFFFLYLTRYSFFPKYLKGFTWLKQNNCRNTFRKCKSFKAMTQDVNLCEFFFS